MESEAWHAYEAEAGDRVTSIGLDAAAVQALLEQARAAWPDLTLAPATFGRILGRAAANAADGIDKLVVGDLALVGQCLDDDARAIAALDRIVSKQAQRVAGYSRLDASEIAQLARVHLLTRRDEGEPRLLQYAGRGSLASWIRVVAGRLALNAERAEGRRPSSHEEFCEPIAQSTPEVALLRAERQDRFAQAFREAYRARDGDERLVLKRYFLGGCTLAELGAELGVHTSTAARRVTGAREALLQDFHRRLQAAVDNDEAEAGQLLEILRSRLALSDAALLQTTEPD